MLFKFKNSKIIFLLITSILFQSFLIPFYSYGIPTEWKACENYQTVPLTCQPESRRKTITQNLAQKQSEAKRVLSELFKYKISGTQPFESEIKQLTSDLKNAQTKTQVKAIIEEAKENFATILRSTPSCQITEQEIIRTLSTLEKVNINKQRSLQQEANAQQKEGGLQIATPLKLLGGALATALAIWAVKKGYDKFKEYKTVSGMTNEASGVVSAVAKEVRENPENSIASAVKGAIKGAGSLTKKQQARLIELITPHIQQKLSVQDGKSQKNYEEFLPVIIEKTLTTVSDLPQNQQQQLIKSICTAIGLERFGDESNIDRLIGSLITDYVKRKASEAIQRCSDTIPESVKTPASWASQKIGEVFCAFNKMLEEASEQGVL